MIEKNNAIATFYGKNSDYLSDSSKIKLQKIKKDLLSLLSELDKKEKILMKPKKKDKK